MVSEYRSSFLREVIVRLDFASPLDISKALPQRLKQTVAPRFPISEPREFLGKELLVTKDATREKVIQGTTWLFHSKEKEKTLTLSRDNANISYKTYDSFNTLKQDFLAIVEELYGVYDNFQGRRLGLRYINEINLSENNPFEWTRYLNDKLLANLNFPEDQSIICRAFNNIEENRGDYVLRFQYGIFNADYPAPVRRKSFVLDYDAYSQAPLSLDDVRQDIDRLHGAIKQAFERSILEGLRQIMRG